MALAALLAVACRNETVHTDRPELDPEGQAIIAQHRVRDVRRDERVVHVIGSGHVFCPTLAYLQRNTDSVGTYAEDENCGVLSDHLVLITEDYGGTPHLRRFRHVDLIFLMDTTASGQYARVRLKTQYNAKIDSELPDGWVERKYFAP